MALGSPLWLIMENIFLSFCEVKWLEQCPKEFKPVCYRRYVDIFILIESAEHLSKFRDYFNTCNPDMSFSFEQEKNGKFSFLDVEVSRGKVKFVATVYRSLLLVVNASFLNNYCQQYTHFVWFMLLLIVVSKFVLIGQSFMKNLVFWKKFLKEQVPFFIFW